MTLYFTEEEMIQFLEKKGYFIETITSWYSQNKYPHGDDMEYINVKLKIAYQFARDKVYPPFDTIKGYSLRPTEMIEQGRKYDLEYNYGIKNTFEKELHKALLNL